MAARSCGDAPSLTTYIGDGTGAFTRGPTSCWTAHSPPDWGVPATLHMVDLNGDLKADLAGYLPAKAHPESPATAQILTAVSTGGGSFVTGVIDTGQAWSDYTATTFSDSCPQDGKKGAPPGDRCAISASQPALWGDFDGDRRTDLAVFTRGAQSGTAQAGFEVAHVFTSRWRWHVRGSGTVDDPASGQRVDQVRACPREARRARGAGR